MEVWFPGLSYLVAGPRILLENYKPGVPISITTPETTYVHLSSPDHIRELVDAPEELLSLHALSKDMFKPEYTMNGLVVQDDMQQNGNLHTRVFRVLLRSHLPALTDPLYRLLSAALEDRFNEAASLSASTSNMNGWSTLSTFEMSKKVVVVANARAFFGPRLASSTKFLEAALSYPEHLLTTAEVLRFIPRSLQSFVAPILMRNQWASKIMVSHITAEIERRRQQTSSNSNQAQNDVDCIQFFMDSTRTNTRKNGWSTEKIVQVLLGIWFAAVHQPAIALVYALEDLCAHPQFADGIHEEASALSTPSYEAIDSLPLLEAFIRESCRLHPSDSISIRRKVVSSEGGSDDKGEDVGRGYIFQDGTRLLQGDVVCVPSQAIMLDPHIYGKDSAEFNPGRFLRPAETVASTHVRNKFTELDPSYPIWGLGRHACPGRYYASLVLKIALLHVLEKYDIKLGSSGPSELRKFQFRSSIVPKASAQIMFRRRTLRN
ncbi:cytochrome P450 [Stachybotrys elegans]|uniref:Cytochrome P450 n=1 Tax=Stachybotrys elegans TaxID=80388 RepID=A0A8K0SLN2_9HYPO|nr:cytochrome P450 [Stachybotrys elegans]